MKSVLTESVGIKSNNNIKWSKAIITKITIITIKLQLYKITIITLATDDDDDDDDDDDVNKKLNLRETYIEA